MIQICLPVAGSLSVYITSHNEPSQQELSPFLYYCGFVKVFSRELEEFAEFMLQSTHYKTSAAIRLRNGT